MENEDCRPRYAIESVDSVLKLLAILRRDGRLTISGSARELGVARSTAHRLISMLRYRQFVVQAEDRSYRPGPMSVGLPTSPTSILVDLVQPHLAWLAEETGETTNLMVLDGANVRFLASAESDKVLRVGSRKGVTLPARRTSGGRALLCRLSAERISALHSDLAAEPGALDAMLSMLVSVRQVGYGTNFEDSETGVTAIGACVDDSQGRSVGAISVSAPTARYRRRQILTLLPTLRTAMRRIESSLSNAVIGPGDWQ